LWERFATVAEFLRHEVHEQELLLETDFDEISSDSDKDIDTDTDININGGCNEESASLT
jgi:hypothetical protein